jgi:hypothetical protein
MNSARSRAEATLTVDVQYFHPAPRSKLHGHCCVNGLSVAGGLTTPVGFAGRTTGRDRQTLREGSAPDVHRSQARSAFDVGSG